MSKARNWAPGWKTTQPPIRERQPDIDAFWAEFEDASGNTVQVRITAQDLKEFGEAPEQLQQKRQHTEQVLRAILETYVREYAIPTTKIDAKDLGSDLSALKRQFRKDP